MEYRGMKKSVTTKPVPNAPRARSRDSTRPPLAQLARERAVWLSKVAATAHFHTLFDHLPGVCFYCKDRDGRFMLVSRSFLQHQRLRHEREILGLTDFDVVPHHMAAGYVRDDARLLSGKARCVERVELWFDRQGTPDWFFVSKLPLKDAQGRICGTAGVVRRAAEHDLQLPVIQSVARAVEILRRDYAGRVVLGEVARACGLSMRHFQRRFAHAFGFSPQEFLLKTRVAAAMKLLEETNLTAAEIASRCGFVDASAFAEQFRQRVGHSPTAYRHHPRAPG
jgi:AraC-like DNA-binding protein